MRLLSADYGANEKLYFRVIGAIGAGGFAKLYHTITIANQSSCGWCLTVQYK